MRFFDIVFSLLALILFLPFFLLIPILIKVNLGSPILFTQLRPGLNERPFMIYKFRTMLNKEYEDKEDNDRLTKFGEFLRSTSLDEIPEFWNVLKGDMSIVGPRPLLMEYLNKYNATQRLRHQLKPGITGWAQVNGRNDTTWDERFKMDVWYVANRSIFLDFKIIILTIVKVFRREGISQRGRKTMKKFE